MDQVLEFACVGSHLPPQAREKPHRRQHRQERRQKEKEKAQAQTPLLYTQGGGVVALGVGFDRGVLSKQNNGEAPIGRWHLPTRLFTRPRFAVRTDASPYGLGAILFEHGVPVAWFADEVTDTDITTLKATRTSEWQAEFELLTIVIAVRVWLHLLTDASFTPVHTDAKAALFTARRLAGRTPAMHFLAGELAISLESNNIATSFFHIPGALNFECDALGRVPTGAAVPERLRAVSRLTCPARDRAWYLTLSVD